MGEKCPFCNIEHNELIDSITEEASKIAEEFTEKSFDKIWGIGMASKLAISMDKEKVAKMMFHTGATQMLAECLLNGHEKVCKNRS